MVFPYIVDHKDLKHIPGLALVIINCITDSELILFSQAHK